MKQISFLAIFFILLICGCSQTYYGKYITINVKQDPIEEFQTNDYTVLAFENKKNSGPESWQWEFWVFYNDVQYYTYRLRSRIVAGSRSFFLVEINPEERSTTIASFQAQPIYDRVKDRLIAQLNKIGSPTF